MQATNQKIYFKSIYPSAHPLTLDTRLTKMETKAEEPAIDPAIKKFTLEEVKKHNTAASTWLIINNQVFDVTKFLDEVSKSRFNKQ